MNDPVSAPNIWEILEARALAFSREVNRGLPLQRVTSVPPAQPPAPGLPFMEVKPHSCCTKLWDQRDAEKGPCSSPGLNPSLVVQWRRRKGPGATPPVPHFDIVSE